MRTRRTFLKGGLSLAVLATVLAVTSLANGAFTPFASSTRTAAPTIRSDKEDYTPGETVTLTGANWQPGEVVHIFVNDDRGQSWSRNVDVTADDGGNISDQFQLPDWFIATYSVTATGPVSGTATTSFTDGNVKISSAAGRHFDYQVTLYSGSTNCTTGAGSATTKTADANGSTTGVGQNDSLLVTANTNANAPNATATFSDWTFPGSPAVQLAAGYSATDRTICVVGFQSGSRDLVGNYAAAPANATPTVAANNASVTVNEGQTAANSGTYSDANAGDNVSISASVGTVTKTGTNSGTWSWSYATTDGPDNSQTVTITANDGNGGVGTTTFALTVNNVAPTVGLSGAATADEGQTKTYTFTVTDPGADTFTVAAGFPDCGTGSSLVGGSLSTNAGGGSFQCSFPDGPASPTVRMQVADSDGAASNVATVGVTVANVAPTIVLTGATSANEGETKTYTYTITDPGNDPDPAITESCGAAGTRTDTPAANSFDCTFPDGPASSVVAVLANDGDPTNNVGSDTKTVAVANVAPTVVLNGDAAANEGQTKTYTYTITDPGNDPNPTITESCGANGTRVDTPAANSFDCTFPNGPATSTVSVSANDGDDTGSDSKVVTIANVAPTVTISGDASANEGQTKTYTYSVSDPGDVPVVTESCGANGTRVDTPAPNSFDCTFPDGAATSTVSVSANDGTVTESASIVVTVANVAPTVVLNGDAAANEGQTKTYTYTITDPGDDPNPVVTESCGANGNRDDTAAPNSFDCTFPDGPATSTVSVSANDGDDTGSDSKLVTINNVAPTVSLTGPAAADEGETKSYSYTVTDPGQDTFSPAAGYPSCGTGGDLVTGSHTTTASGGSFNCKFTDGPASPSVQIQVNDSDGAPSNISSVAVTVANVAPTVSLNGPASADEGETKSYSYTVTDPGQDTFTAASGFPSCGTGGDLVTGSHTTTASGGSFNCKFTDGPASPSVQMKVNDSDGAGSNTDSVDVTVANVAPTVSLTGPAAADEGQTKSYSYTVNDPGQDTFAAAAGFPSCGTGGDLVTGSHTTTASGGSFNCKFTDGPASPSVQIQVNDSDGAPSNVSSVAVTVANVAPSVSLSGPAAADEGQTKTYSYTVTDPGQDTFSAASGYPSCGIGGDLVTGSHTTTASGGSFNCKFTDGPASPSVQIRVEDSDGAPSNVASVAVNVSNVAPTVNLSGPNAADEGESKSYTYTVADPGQDTFATAAGFPSCGTGGDLVTGSDTTTASGGSFDCKFPDGPASPSVQIQVNDSDGATSNVSTVVVTVSNVAPSVSLSGPNAADEGETKAYSYTVSDPGQDTFTAAAGFPDCGTGGDLVAGSHVPTATGGSFSCRFPDGPASPSVRMKVNDSDGAGSNTASVAVIVANVAPTVSLTGPAAADEGQTKSYSYTVNDPGQDTFAAAAGFPSCGTGGDLVAGSHATTASGGSFQCKFPDGPATPTVRMKVDDSDGAGSSIDTVDVTVSNVAPTVVLSSSNDLTVDEGSTHTYNYSISDPGQDTVQSVETNCGGNGTKVAGSDTNTDTSGSFQCRFPDGPAGSAVSARATDSDGATGVLDSQNVTVNNVAPTVTLTGPDAANEGQTKTYDYTVTDPGDDPNPAITESCGANGSRDDTPAANSFDCTFPDGPASSTVIVTANDGDPSNNVGSASKVVAIANVAPTVALTGPATALEGETKSYAYTVTDPGQDGFTAASGFPKCGTGGSVVSGSHATTASGGSFDCRFADGPASPSVEIKVNDTDNAPSNVSSVAVTVSNVKPTITSFTGTGSLSGTLAFAPSSFSGTFTDPGLVDNPWVVSWTWDGVPDATTQSVGANGTNTHTFGPTTHTFTTAGCAHRADVKVTDKDGAYDTATTTVQVGTGAFLPPMTNQPVTDKLRNGQVLPVKVEIKDCNGQPVTNLQPAIQLKRGDLTQGLSDDSLVTITPESVSSADTTGVMRLVDSHYQYNMKVNVPAADVGVTDYTVMIYPYGLSNAAQTLRHVIRATK